MDRWTPRLTNIISDKVVGAAGSGGTDYLYSPPTPDNSITLITLTSITIAGHDADYIDLGTTTDGSFNILEQQTSPTANLPYWSTSYIILKPRDRLTARIRGATVGDQITMTYQGITLYIT